MGVQYVETGAIFKAKKGTSPSLLLAVFGELELSVDAGDDFLVGLGFDKSAYLANNA